MDSTDGFVTWPRSLAESFKASGIWNGKTIYKYLEDSAACFGPKVAIKDGDVNLTYDQLVQYCETAAIGLRNLGFVKGDTIVIQLPNRWEFFALLFACLKIGVVPVLALPGHRYGEMEYFVEHVEAKAIAVPSVLKGFDHQAMATELVRKSSTVEQVFVLGDLNSVIKDDLVDLRSLLMEVTFKTDSAGEDSDLGPSPDDIAVFLLSGGTTGLPKLIPRTHNDYGYNFRKSAEVCQLNQGSVYGSFLPIAHNFPLACPGVLGTLYVGGTAVLAGSPEPSYALDLIIKEAVTITAVVPAIAQRWMEHISKGNIQFSSRLRVLQVGGARMAPELARKVRPMFGCTLQQVFGMAEGLVNYTRLDDSDDEICETQGRPMSEMDEIALLNSDGTPALPGDMGELVTQGPYTLRGYFRAQEQNLSSFTSDGWYRTGDVVKLSKEGNLIVLGRTKDMINRAGEKISAEEVENLMYRIPNVEQVAVLAIPDPELGERVCAVVVSRDPNDLITIEKVREYFEGFNVAKFKFPEQLEVVDELPTTNVGKIDKAKLRKLLSNGL